VHASLTLAVALLFGAVFMQFRQTLTTVFRNMDINHSPGLFTVQVTGLPQSLNDPKVLQGHLDVVYPDKWIAAHLVASMTDLKELQDTKNNLEAKLEQCKQVEDDEGIRPRHCVCCGSTSCCGPVDTIEELQTELINTEAKTDVECDRLLNDGIGASGRAFVTFKSPDAAVQMVEDFAPTGQRAASPYSAELQIEGWQVERAPEPDDIIWENATVGKWQHRGRVFVLNFVFFWFTTVVLTPVAFINGISGFTDQNLGAFGELWSAYIPMMVLCLYVWIAMPAMLRVISHYERHWLKSEAEHSFLIKYYLYLFIAAVICPVLSTSTGALIESLTSEKSSIQSNLGDVLVDKAGQTYMIYVMNFALLSTPLQLFNLDHRATGWAGTVAAKTKLASVDVRTKPSDSYFDYPLQYATVMHIFAVIVFFSIFSPLVTCFGALYFIIKHVVDRYNLVNYHQKSSQSGGRLASTANHLIVASVALLMLGMTGFFSTKQSARTAIFTFVCLVVLTVLYLCIVTVRTSTTGGSTRSALPPTLRHVLDTTTGGLNTASEHLEEGVQETLSLVLPVRLLPGFRGVTSYGTAKTPTSTSIDQSEIEQFETEYAHPAMKLYEERNPHSSPALAAANSDCNPVVALEHESGDAQSGNSWFSSSRNTDDQDQIRQYRET